MSRRILESLIYSSPAALALVLFCAISAFALNCPSENVQQFYAANLRGSLFAGFLTLGSFLLSLKTGIVIKIKEGLFDSADYKKRLDERRALNPSLTAYGPLRRLNRLLSNAVLSALIAAALQLTVGLIPHWTAAAFCMACAVFSLALLLSSFYLIQSNLNIWFDLIDEVEERRARQPQSASETEGKE